MKNHLLILCLAFFFSCEKERPVNPYFAEVYPQILEGIDIECIEGESEYYIYAKINGEEICVYEDHVDVGFKFGVTTTFTTSSPEFTTGEIPSNARRTPILFLGNPSLPHQEYFNFGFPNFHVGRSVYDFLDSLTHIKNHDVMGEEDVVVPDGTPIDVEGLIRSGGGFKNNFLIKMNSLDKYTETGGITFSISTIFGNQDGSYLRFNEVRKIKEPDGIYYFMDISFECNLYHWPQYGYEGLWGEIREGRIVVKVKVKE